jgi:4-diphosphocytidyl-2-C-methyl-D-erythritol kinase
MARRRTRVTMVSFPPCKINLGLHVLSKRADGYHDIETCFYPVPWTDILEIVPAKTFSFEVSGLRVPGPSADNLCVRAYELLRRKFDLPAVAIHLHKCLPMGAGLGGGSSNAAYVLKTINTIFDLGISSEELKGFAAKIGSDCSFFIDNQPCIGTGRGEILSEVSFSLKGKFLIIVKPDAEISTAVAYAGVTPSVPAQSVREIVEKHPVEDWKSLLTNDFEKHLFIQFPIVEALHQKLYANGAVFARMTGSGSAVFGLFNQAIDLRKEFETFTYWSGHLD